jgi:heme oxygenase
MAMLAGGQIIKKIVKKSLQPPENAGLDAFEFNTKSRMVSHLRSTI